MSFRAKEGREMLIPLLGGNERRRRGDRYRGEWRSHERRENREYSLSLWRRSYALYAPTYAYVHVRRAERQFIQTRDAALSLFHGFMFPKSNVARLNFASFVNLCM